MPSRSPGPATSLRSSSSRGTTAASPRVSWRPAGSLWGLSAGEAEERIRAEHGADWQVAAIGPAGERLIPFATISHDGRHAGRGGLGAVLGSKRIKAIAVRGRPRTPLADPRADGRAGAKRSPRSRSGRRPRSTASSARSPTCWRSTGSTTLPTRNFQAGRFEGAERLAAEDLGPGAADRPQLVRRVHDRLRAHLRGGSGSGGPARVRVALRPRSALRRRRSGRRACGGRRPATTPGSTRSAPARPSPS